MSLGIQRKLFNIIYVFCEYTRCYFLFKDTGVAIDARLHDLHLPIPSRLSSIAEFPNFYKYMRDPKYIPFKIIPNPQAPKFPHSLPATARTFKGNIRSKCINVPRLPVGHRPRESACLRYERYPV